MNNRRKLLVALAAPFSCFAQTPAAGMHRIGFLGVTSGADTETRLEALRVGLRKLGYVEGTNITIEYRFAQGKYERLADLATELVSLKIDVIVTYSNLGARAAKQATTTIPIVVATSADLVSKGLVNSLARPGGNITGASVFTGELGQKRLEMLKEAMPRVKRVAYLMNPGSDVADSNLRTILVAAKALKLEVQPFEARSPDQFSSAFAAMSKQHISAVLLQEEPMLVSSAKLAMSHAARHGLPAIGFATLAEAGGLIGYGASHTDMFRRAAVFVDKILKGAKPGDLPIEQAMTFELVVNLSTAKVLGLTIAQSVLARADRVIE